MWVIPPCSGIGELASLCGDAEFGGRGRGYCWCGIVCREGGIVIGGGGKPYGIGVADDIG